MFDFVDLFAGIGGFHAALRSLGGRGVLAAEIDPHAARVYQDTWGLAPHEDVRDLAADPRQVPDHAVLTGGFPCQPFSKSGRQLGMAEERGTLFHDIVRVLEAKQPPVVMLENVRNIAGRRQRETWRTVVRRLRDAGYRVPDEPCVFSPHLLPPEAGGAPQVRERVYVLGVLVGPERAHLETNGAPVVENRPQLGWNPSLWSIKKHVLLPEPSGVQRQRYRLTDDEETWINTWNQLLARLGPDVALPGFPLWEPAWNRRRVDRTLPEWKQSFLRKNQAFYVANRHVIDAWRRDNRQLQSFPTSRRKLEWQAQDGPRDLWKLLLQLRPSGIRAKQPTYAPALVAMTQTTIFGPYHRRLTPAECARLQGLEGVRFGPQTDKLSYKQLGNAVNVGAARFVLRRFVEDNPKDIADAGPLGRQLVDSVLAAPEVPVVSSGVRSA